MTLFYFQLIQLISPVDLIQYLTFRCRRMRKSSRGNKGTRQIQNNFDYDSDGEKKKDKKLVFLSKSVL